jgi:hypothetical protein
MKNSPPCDIYTERGRSVRPDLGNGPFTVDTRSVETVDNDTCALLVLGQTRAQ